MISTQKTPHCPVDLDETYFSKYNTFGTKEILFMFFLTQEMRKLFLEALSIQKYFVDDFMPYLDIDFIKLLFQIQFAGLYYGIFEDNPIKRRKDNFCIPNY